MAELYNNIVRTARKYHRCIECSGWIKPKEIYHVRSYLFEGEWNTEKVCQFCNLTYEKEVCEDGPVFGGLAEWLFELCRYTEPHIGDVQMAEAFMQNALDRGSTDNFMYWLSGA